MKYMKFHLVLIKNLREGFFVFVFSFIFPLSLIFFLVLPKALAEFFK